MEEVFHIKHSKGQLMLSTKPKQRTFVGAFKLWVCEIGNWTDILTN